MSERRFRVGAAVGSGMAAQAAERAGADFILALGAGKMRSMGVASPASLLPVYDGVEFTIDFALTEILPRTQLPVFVGLPLFDPRIEPEPLVQRLKSIGIRGLTNFPAVFHLGAQASALEDLGYGRSREVAFLSAAARAGLETIGYVRSRSDATALIRAGISTLCVNFSLNPHRNQDAETEEMLDRTTVALRRVTQNLRKPHLNLTFYLGGGPVSGGASMDRLCRNAGIDGFIGGSALDRVPLERSLVNSVASFREIEVLQNQVQSLQRRLHRLNERHGIITHSGAMNEMLDLIDRHNGDGRHIVLAGETGTGRLDIARLVADKVKGDRRRKSWAARTDGRHDTIEQLFGRAAQGDERKLIGLLDLAEPGAPVVVPDIERLSRQAQEQLAQLLAKGTYMTVGDNRPRQSEARIIMTIAFPYDAHSHLDPALAEILAPLTVQVPPLRDRPEDIPSLARRIVQDLDSENTRLSGAMIRTLMRHTWPGNLNELRSVIDWIVGRKFACSEAELITRVGQSEIDSRSGPISQRDRITKALLLNNLNRSRTADFLGISRKTLYNQIVKYRLLS